MLSRASSITYHKIWIEKTSGEVNVCLDVDIDGAKGRKVEFIAYFESPKNKGITGGRGSYSTKGGKVCASRTVHPKYSSSHYGNLKITLPLSYLPVAPGTKVYVQCSGKIGSNNKGLSPYASFTMSGKSDSRRSSSKSSPKSKGGSSSSSSQRVGPFDRRDQVVKGTVPRTPNVSYKSEMEWVDCWMCGGNPSSRPYGSCAICNNTGIVRNPKVQVAGSAFVSLAKHYLVENNYRKAFECVMPYATGRQQDACYILGKCYELGIGVSRHIPSAKYWYGKAGQKGKAEIGRIKNLGAYKPTAENIKLVKYQWACEHARDVAWAESYRQARQSERRGSSGRRYPMPEYEDENGNWSDSRYRESRRANCTHCHGTGINSRPQSSMPSSQLIVHYNRLGEKCYICGHIEEHWHQKCTSCYVPR